MKTFRGITHIDLVKKHAEALALDGTIVGMAIEREVGGKDFVDEDGFDYYLNNATVECKSTSMPMNPNDPSGSFVLRINCNPKSKKGQFQFIHIVDALNDREFMIPQKAYWDYVGDAKEFHWSASYNETDNVKTENTKWLLNYPHEPVDINTSR